MDVDCDFLKPSHESMEVNSAQPNIVAGSLHIAVLSPNKIPAQDILEISTPNYLQRESEQKNDAGNAVGQNVMIVRQKATAKTDVITATKNIVIRVIVDDSQGPTRTILIAQM